MKHKLKCIVPVTISTPYVFASPTMKTPGMLDSILSSTWTVASISLLSFKFNFVGRSEASPAGKAPLIPFRSMLSPSVKVILKSSSWSAVERSLHEAANRGYHEIVRLLLAYSVKGKYRSLWVPFRVASRCGYEPTPNTVGPDEGIASEG